MYVHNAAAQIVEIMDALVSNGCTHLQTPPGVDLAMITGLTGTCLRLLQGGGTVLTLDIDQLQKIATTTLELANLIIQELWRRLGDRPAPLKTYDAQRVSPPAKVCLAVLHILHSQRALIILLTINQPNASSRRIINALSRLAHMDPASYFLDGSVFPLHVATVSAAPSEVFESSGVTD